MNEPHQFPVRVYFEDTDFSGHVYHGSYVKFFERGRTEWLRTHNISHSDLAEQGLVFAVRQIKISFQAPAKIDDELLVKTDIEQVGGARIALDQKIYCGAKLLTSAKVVIVILNAKGRATRMPKDLLVALEAG